MLADDLVCRIALDALGAGIPAGYPPFRVEHEDRVVDDRLNEQAKCFVIDVVRHSVLVPSKVDSVINP